MIHTLPLGMYMEKADKFTRINTLSGFHKKTEPEADSLFANNYLTGCTAREIRIRGKGSKLGKEGEQTQSDASPSW